MMWQVIYIAPLKALVRERMDGWGKGLARSLNKKLVSTIGSTINGPEGHPLGPSSEAEI